MRKIFTLFALFTVLVAGAITMATNMAKAEGTGFSDTVKQYPTTDYSPVQTQFLLSEIADVLGTDAATLEAALKDGSAQFGLFDANDALIATTADGPGSYWTKADGSVTNWGNESIVYNGLINYSASDDHFSIPLGQYPGAMQAGDTWTNTYTLKYNGASTTFTVTLKVVAAPDFTATVEQYPTNDYSPVSASYKLSDIATKLGTDAATLAAALADGTAQFGLFDANGELIASTADGPGSYWTTPDGDVTNWGNNSLVYNGLINYNAEEDVFNIPVGQYPDAMQADDSWSNTYTIKYGEASVAIEVILNVVDRPTMVDPTDLYSNLEIVKEYTGTLEFKADVTEGAKTFTVDMSDICESLGVKEKELNANLEKVMRTRQILADESGAFALTDTLQNPRATTDGWFGRYTNFDEASGIETTLAQNALRSWGSGCTFYLQNPKLNEGVFTMTYGQYTKFAIDDTDYAEVYIVNGTKAAKLTVNINVTEVPKAVLSEMEKVGEQTVAGTVIGADAYNQASADLDVDDIVAKLGCEAGDFVSWNYASETELISPTLGTDYWQSEEGYAQAWGDNPCGRVTVNLNDASVTIMEMYGRYTNIEEPTTFRLYYIYTNPENTKYYVINCDLTVKPQPKLPAEEDRELVSVEEFTMQIVPSPDTYQYGDKYYFDPNYIEEMIGTRDFNVWGDKWNEEQGKLVWDNRPTCYDGDEKGTGFWFGDTTYENEEGQVVVDNAGWGQNSFGFQVNSKGEFTWFQFPGQRQAGDQFTANVYLINYDNGKYIKFVINVLYVDEVSEIKTVGSQTAAVYAPADQIEAGEFFINLKTKALCDSLGITAAELSDVTPIIMKSRTVMYYSDFEELAPMNAKGYYENNEEAAVFYGGVLVSEDNKLQLHIDPLDLNFAEVGTTAKMNLAFEYDNKRYYYTVTLFGEIGLINGELADNAAGWDLTAEGGSVVVNNNTTPTTAEAYAGWGDLDLTSYGMSQKVVLPAGTYKLSAYAFYRYGLSADVDPTISNAELYAGKTSVKVATLGGITVDGNYANSMDEAAAAFNAGLYLNELVFTVEEDGTEVELGIKGTHDLKQSWFIAGPMTLEAVAGESIGNEDFTSGWWTAFSSFYTMEKGQTATISFDNYNPGSGDNWHNWILIAQKQGVEVNGAGDDEYFALRNDNYGWGGKYGPAVLQNNFDWSNFMPDMNGSHVDMVLSMDENGAIAASSIITTAAGKEYTYEYKSLNIAGVNGFTFFFTVENSYIKDLKVNITGTPTAINTVVAAPATTGVQKILRGGKVVIVKNGVEYNVAGARIK